MEYINKSVNEPKKLVKFRRKYKLDEKIKKNKKIEFCHLDQTIKEYLRNILLEDQGFICCYCQKRIPEKILPQSKIEHFLCQEDNKNKVFDFRNLFIACNGKIGKVETCDTAKGASVLESIDLLDSNLSNYFKYTKTGIIYSSIAPIDNDIDILNLNDQNLKKDRQAVYQSIQFIKKKISNRGGDFQKQIAKEVLRWKSKDDQHMFKEYKSAGLYFLS